MPQIALSIQRMQHIPQQSTRVETAKNSNSHATATSPTDWQGGPLWRNLKRKENKNQQRNADAGARRSETAGPRA